MSSFETSRLSGSGSHHNLGLTRRICVLFGCLGLIMEFSSWYIFGESNIPAFAMVRVLICLIALVIGAFAGKLFSNQHCAWVCAGLLTLMPLVMGIDNGGNNSRILAFCTAFPVFFTLLLGQRFTILGAAAGLFVILFLCIFPLESIHIMFSDQAFESTASEFTFSALIPIFLCTAATYTLARQNQEMQEKLNRDAAFDNLTGIPNRRAFDRQVIDEIERAHRVKTPLSMMVFDIDNFKMYNDLYGHQAGDQALKAVARAIDSVCVRSTDFVARYGGEEFVALLPATTDDRAELLAAKIRTNLRRIKDGPVADHNITLSAGIAVLNGESRVSAEELFRRADEALYESKRNGKDCVTLYPNTPRKASIHSIG